MNTLYTFNNKLILSLLLALGSLSLNAQQDAQFTQFMFNKLIVNPAYAGASVAPCLSAIHRQQWAGLEGAPISSAISFNMPLPSNKVGLGMNLIHDKVGPTTSWKANLAYAYRVHLKKGVLSLGVQANLHQYQVSWKDERTAHQGDNLLSNAQSSKILPNAGLGIYYETSTFYAGFSAPHLLKGDLSLLKEIISSTELNSLEQQHFFGIAGFLVDLNKNLKLKPAVLFKYVNNAPLDVDLNLSVILLEKLWLGMSFRWGGSTEKGVGESLDFLVQYQVSERIRLGAAFDFTMSEINSYSSGTYEFFAHYCFMGSGNQETVANPRFF